ncbi:MFS transporter [Gammaproteobacteria bacterium]|nr:MFS transporter [Gammaproteobacteria bacterium]
MGKEWFISVHFSQGQIKQLALLTLLMILTVACVDIHLASMPQMMIDMQTTKHHMQQSFSLYFLGAAFGLFLCGTWSDKIGRKPVVLFGIILSCLVCFLSAINDHIYVFILLRFLMGIGSSVYGLALVIIADMLKGKQLITATAFLMLIFLLGPMVAPMVGGYIQHWFGWQQTFFILGGLLVGLIGLWVLFFNETNQHQGENALTVKNFLKCNLGFIKNKLFVGCTLVAGIVGAASNVYLGLSSFIFQHEFHVSPIAFGWYTVGIGVATIFWAKLCPYFISRLKDRASLKLSIFILFLSGLLCIALVYMGMIGSALFLLCAAFAMLAVMIVKTVGVDVVLSPFPDKRGMAAALYGALQLLLSFLITSGVAGIHFSGISVIGWTYIALAMASYLMYLRWVKI